MYNEYKIISHVSPVKYSKNLHSLTLHTETAGLFVSAMRMLLHIYHAVGITVDSLQ